MNASPLTDGEQAELRERFREHWEHGVGFNRACELAIERWDPDGVEIRLPFRDDLGAHPGVFHGGVLAALIDTTACGAIAAGHDYTHGHRISTVSMSIQYLAVDPGHDAVATGRCSRRGRRLHFAHVVVSSARGKVLAEGLVTVSVTADRNEPHLAEDQT